MAPVPCGKCGNSMSSESVVCPHCGARRADAKPGVAGKLSPDEIRALLVTDAAVRSNAPTEGMFGTLVLPHASTRGVARGVELLLTIACFPLVAAGTLLLMFTRRDSKSRETQGELAPVITMSLLGAPLLLGIFGLTTLGFAMALGSIVGLSIRGAIRSHAATAANRELTQMKK